MASSNCAQAVVVAFSDLTGLDEAFSAKLSCSFGGGMGRMREVCGAVSGMLMVAGLLYGYDWNGQDDYNARTPANGYYGKILPKVYTGTGESGWNSQNSLTFPFVPKMVLIVDETYGASGYGSVCWMGQSFGASQVQFSLTNKTLSWYTTYDDSPEYQMNKFGDKYTYFAVG